MRKFGILLILLTINLLCDAQNTNKLAPSLLAAFNLGETADVLVVMREQAAPVPPKNLKHKTEKGRFVFEQLRETTLRTQQNAWRIAREQGLAANSFYLVNALSISQCTREAALALAALPEVKYLAPDPYVQFAQPAQEPLPVSGRSGIEWGVDRINAPAVWALGYTGQGITVGGADTGYDWVHPALKNHYRGYFTDLDTFDHQYNWHDAIHESHPLNGVDTLNPCGFDAQYPCDDNSHGTHTMGSMTGDDGQGNQIGVAPGAKWVGCRNMDRGWGKPSTYLECFEWFLAPTDLDGNNPAPDKAPHVINNSWYCAVQEGCLDLAINELLRLAVVNLRQAGVVVVVSNGNFGGQGCASTYGPPAYFEESFSVGATRFDDAIADFSSRGPVTIDSSGRTKPNVSAPGQDIRSSTPNGGYANFSGTSMAGPHVVGLVALILSARPDLAGQVDLIEDIIEKTCVYSPDPLACGTSSAAVPNMSFGYGRVDALGAVNLALLQTPVAETNPVFSATCAPNPTRSDCLFETQGMLGETTLELFERSGRVALSRHWTGQGHDRISVSLTTLPAGIYFWKIQASNHTATGKVVKE